MSGNSGFGEAELRAALLMAVNALREICASKGDPLVQIYVHRQEARRALFGIGDLILGKASRPPDAGVEEGSDG